MMYQNTTEEISMTSAYDYVCGEVDRLRAQYPKASEKYDDIELIDVPETLLQQDEFGTLTKAEMIAAIKNPKKIEIDPGFF